MLCKIGILKSFKKHFLTRRVKTQRVIGQSKGTWALNAIRYLGIPALEALGHSMHFGTRALG